MIGRLAKRLRDYLGPRTVILLYHRVVGLPADPLGLCVSPAHFEQQLAVLRRFGRPMTVAQLAAAIREHEMPRRAVVVTFDDGYLDNLTIAKPLLERFEVPATMFLTTGQAGRSRAFWWDHQGDSDIRASHQAMALEDSAKLAEGGLVEVGAHTVDHPRLVELPLDEQKRQIEQSKADLERAIGRPVSSFSYPHGLPSDYTADTVRLVRDAGFSAACSAFPGVVWPDSDLLQLARFNVRDWDAQEFCRRLESFFRNEQEAAT